ncbi:MAG: alanine racemase [Chloroflexi bacterium]|nr:alanine racemase [Chloroflexota bacterium]
MSQRDTWRRSPSWVEVDLDAIASNVGKLKRLVGSKTELMTIVKANAYGHGAAAVALAALSSGATRLGVAYIEEGIALRRQGITAPILVHGYTSPDEAEHAVEHDLTIAACSEAVAEAVSRSAMARNTIAKVHIKVDSGFGRFGLPPAEVASFARKLSQLPNIATEGLFTHFATADEADKGFTHQQFQAFRWALGELDVAGIAIPCRHVANSAATLDMPELHLDMVRCGIATYGLYPSRHVNHRVDLRPALTLKSRIVRLFPLPSGHSVGYGRTFTTSRPSRLALVSIGYADGLPRALSNRGSLLVHGRRAAIVGRISMDQCVIDVTDIPEVAVAEEVVVIGRQGDAEITADEVAEAAGTISYEVLCGIGIRVPRLYLREGRVVGQQSLLDSLATPLDP